MSCIHPCSITTYRWSVCALFTFLCFRSVKQTVCCSRVLTHLLSSNLGVSSHPLQPRLGCQLALMPRLSHTQYFTVFSHLSNSTYCVYTHVQVANFIAALKHFQKYDMSKTLVCVHAKDLVTVNLLEPHPLRSQTFQKKLQNSTPQRRITRRNSHPSQKLDLG